MKQLPVEQEDIQEFVESLYKDGKRPCESFGLDAKELGELPNPFNGEAL